MSELKSDRMLDALERLEVIKEDLKHDRADIGNYLHMAIETLKEALAQQLLHERRRQSPASAALLSEAPPTVAEPPDIDCITRADGECVAPECWLHDEPLRDRMMEQLAATSDPGDNS